jgi:para-nitrobenzyl esterase
MLSIAIVLAGSFASAAITEPVKLDAGMVSGAAGNDAAVRVFKGIPFAAPPVGPLRWKAPQPPAKWEGVKTAVAFGPRCMQGGGGGAGGRRGAGAPEPPATGEDCLYINVWTAASSSSARLPVMVWSYGGAFTQGSGSTAGYDGEALAKKGVVFVTYNYRVGPFGFFAHPELTKESGHNASGNYGVMDLHAALKWVHANIAAFGGDPGRVTLVGESAGAALESVLVGSKEARGLYQRVIAESASWSGVRMDKMQTLAEAEAAGKATAEKNGANSLAELRAKSADDIMKLAAGRPIVDGWYVTEDLSKTYAAGRQTDVDVLVGSNQNEAGFAFFGVPKGSAAEFRAQIKDRFADRADQFLKMYPSATDAESNAAQVASFNDEVAWNMRSWAMSESKRGKGKAYLYFFTKIPPANGNQPSRGAIHTAEIPYALGNGARNWTDADRKLSETMTGYWVNFATAGDPNGKGLPVWPEFLPQYGNAMMLGDKVEPVQTLGADKIALYDYAFARMMSMPAPRATSGH